MSDPPYPPPAPPPPPPGPPWPPAPAPRRSSRRTVIVLVAVVATVVLGMVATMVWLGFAFLRYLGDWFDTVDPPAPSARVGAWFTTDDGDLRIKVTSLECHADDAADDEYGGDGELACTFAFDVENRSDRVVSLNDITVKSVVDGAWSGADVADPASEPRYGSIQLEAGARKSLTGSVSPGTGHLDGIVFDADDASSHSAVVVDAGDASSPQ
ncbi:hypothetical protein ACFFOS_00180 [Nocardioides kongjuensis]|uniref:DUF4352 domain-containing protein n=1 Tax=Nocardioides kongjuensis TaxID=349522 RepID=A0A852R583_9ACTN|nr:hypothetical protein [Nocardioides kongjuensis]NYD29973.1 hypothetical protein [Nocardioides kongjuensis]